jgi:hypothetical protein
MLIPLIMFVLAIDAYLSGRIIAAVILTALGLFFMGEIAEALMRYLLSDERKKP